MTWQLLVHTTSSAHGPAERSHGEWGWVRVELCGCMFLLLALPQLLLLLLVQA